MTDEYATLGKDEHLGSLPEGAVEHRETEGVSRRTPSTTLRAVPLPQRWRLKYSFVAQALERLVLRTPLVLNKPPREQSAPARL